MQNFILQTINKAAEGLFFISEGDNPFELIHIIDVKDSLELQLILLTGKEKDTPVSIVSLEQFIQSQYKIYNGSSSEQEQNVHRLRNLEKVIKESLTDVIVYRIGKVQIDAFILGLLPDGSYGGLRTKIIET